MTSLAVLNYNYICTVLKTKTKTDFNNSELYLVVCHQTSTIQFLIQSLQGMNNITPLRNFKVDHRMRSFEFKSGIIVVSTIFRVEIDCSRLQDIY